MKKLRKSFGGSENCCTFALAFRKNEGVKSSCCESAKKEFFDKIYINRK